LIAGDGAAFLTGVVETQPLAGLERATQAPVKPFERSVRAFSGQRRTAMDSLIGFAEVTGAILGALGLALGLEWATLNGLFRLMPARERKEKQ
jgi:hypothetical protein